MRLGSVRASGGQLLAVAALACGIAASSRAAVPATAAPACRLVRADVVALEQAYIVNRFGAFVPAGMMFALRRDVVPVDGATVEKGNVKLRPDKCPRPLVLRANGRGIEDGGVEAALRT